MSEIRNLTRNGETFYPLTHEKAVIGMEDFKDTITEQIDNYRPIEITGNVTNAPDEEDITSDANNLLKFKNRNNLYGLGKVILRRGSSFSSQITQANTIYVIQYNFDLGEARINIPNGSILLFEGGTLSNGTLVCADLYDVRLVYYQDISEILSSVTLEGNFIHKACDKDTIRQILVDNQSITKDVNDVLSVKANGIQNSHLNSNVVDNSGIALDSNNKISIKDGGVTGSKLNSGIVNTDDLSIDNNKLQLADRGTTSGMGMIILRKDQSFASQLTQTNTIYVIRYIFTLTGDVIIPANCVLEFDGGSISGGGNTITGQNTKIEYFGPIFNNIIISGTWDVPVIRSSMYMNISGTVENTDNDNKLRQLFNFQNSNIDNTVIIESGNYYVSCATSEDIPITLSNNTHLIIDGKIILRANNFNGYCIINIPTGSENIQISGDGYIIGDRYIHTGTAGEHGHCIVVGSSNNVTKNITIKNVHINNAWGDGIYYTNVDAFIVEGCCFDGNSRSAISCISGKNIVIRNNAISNTNRTAPGDAIAFEPNYREEEVVNVIVENNIIDSSWCGISLIAARSWFRNIKVVNNVVKCNITQHPIVTRGIDIYGDQNPSGHPTYPNEYHYCENVEIKNNIVEGCVRPINCKFGKNINISNNRFILDRSDIKSFVDDYIATSTVEYPKTEKDLYFSIVFAERVVVENNYYKVPFMINCRDCVLEKNHIDTLSTKYELTNIMAIDALRCKITENNIRGQVAVNEPFSIIQYNTIKGKDRLLFGWLSNCEISYNKFIQEEYNYYMMDIYGANNKIDCNSFSDEDTSQVRTGIYIQLESASHDNIITKRNVYETAVASPILDQGTNNIIES